MRPHGVWCGPAPFPVGRRCGLRPTSTVAVGAVVGSLRWGGGGGGATLLSATTDTGLLLVYDTRALAAGAPVSRVVLPEEVACRVVALRVPRLRVRVCACSFV